MSVHDFVEIHPIVVEIPKWWTSQQTDIAIPEAAERKLHCGVITRTFLKLVFETYK